MTTYYGQTDIIRTMFRALFPFKGICGSLLKCNRFKFEMGVTGYIKLLLDQVKKLMLLTRAKNIEGIKKISIYQRGEDLSYFKR